MFAIPMPSDLPHEASDTEVKVAAADAAQATANAAQDVADECRKTADDAISGDPLADTQKVCVRALAHDATQTVIHQLRKLNQTKP